VNDEAFFKNEQGKKLLCEKREGRFQTTQQTKKNAVEKYEC
jgi:hypothetical protein